MFASYKSELPNSMPVTLGFGLDSTLLPIITKWIFQGLYSTFKSKSWRSIFLRLIGTSRPCGRLTHELSEKWNRTTRVLFRLGVRTRIGRQELSHIHTYPSPLLKSATPYIEFCTTSYDQIDRSLDSLGGRRRNGIRTHHRDPSHQQRDASPRVETVGNRFHGLCRVMPEKSSCMISSILLPCPG